MGRWLCSTWGNFFKLIQRANPKLNRICFLLLQWIHSKNGDAAALLKCSKVYEIAAVWCLQLSILVSAQQHYYYSNWFPTSQIHIWHFHCPFLPSLQPLPVVSKSIIRTHSPSCKGPSLFVSLIIFFVSFIDFLHFSCCLTLVFSVYVFCSPVR